MFFQVRWDQKRARPRARTFAFARALVSVVFVAAGAFAFLLAFAFLSAPARADDDVNEREQEQEQKQKQEKERPAASASAAPRFVPLGRSVAQDQGAWVVDYRLRLDGPTGLVLGPGSIAVKAEGWVSNARIASHAVPRFSSLSVPSAGGMENATEVVASSDDAQRCLEKLIVTVWAGPGPAPSPSKRSRAHEAGPAPPLIGVAPGETLNVRLRFEHVHVLYGTYDPLLGVRSIELNVAGAVVRDDAPLDHEHYLALPRYRWPEPPIERRGTRHARSGPDSLHLEAHVPGRHYYRFPERPVRYSTRMRLRFWYLIAAGTEGPCRYRIAQYKDTPTSWRQLNAAGLEGKLARVGRWARVERVFETDAEATTLALDFRIDGDSEVGEMWIDDVCLEVVGGPGDFGP